MKSIAVDSAMYWSSVTYEFNSYFPQTEQLDIGIVSLTISIKVSPSVGELTSRLATVTF